MLLIYVPVCACYSQRSNDNLDVKNMYSRRSTCTLEGNLKNILEYQFNSWNFFFLKILMRVWKLKSWMRKLGRETRTCQHPCSEDQFHHQYHWTGWGLSHLVLPLLKRSWRRRQAGSGRVRWWSQKLEIVILCPDADSLHNKCIWYYYKTSNSLKIIEILVWNTHLQ